jgi:predicted membrane protein DUF2079
LPVTHRALPGLLFVLLVCAVYADPLFLRRSFAGRDLLAYNLPMEKAVHDAYARGRLPVWMPYVSGGRPLLANPNAGALYPARPLLAAVPFPLAMRIFPVAHWALAGLGVFCLLRSIGGSRGAAWIAAVTYAFSGVAVSEVFFAHYMAGLAFLPWILWILARRAEARRKILALSVLFALVLLSGDVFQIALVFGSALLWTVLEVERRARIPHLAVLGFSGALAALAAAPQIVATAFWIPETGRAVSGMTLNESLLFSISPFRLFELVVPYPFGSTFAVNASEVWTRSVFHGKGAGLFATLYAGAFSIVAAAALSRGRAPGVRFARALALLALAMSVIPSLVRAKWGAMASPVALRNPEKFAVGLTLALAILAGIAFDRFRRTPPRPRALLAVGAVLCLLALAVSTRPESAGRIALQLIGEPYGPARLAGEKLAAGFAEAGLLWMATLIAIESRRALPRAGPAVCLALLTLVPIAANRRIARTFPEEAVLAPTPFARFLQRADPYGQYRTLGMISFSVSELAVRQAGSDPGEIGTMRSVWTNAAPGLWGRGTVFNTDFDSGDLSRMRSLRELTYAAARHLDPAVFFGALSLRWAVRFRDQDSIAGYRRVGGDSMIEWDESRMAFPDVRLLTNWREKPGAVTALRVITNLAPGEIVVESGREAAGSARPGRLRIFEKSAERVLLQAEAPDSTWLFVLREYWSHRAVLLDGRPAEVAPAQLAFSAVRIPAGRHAVEWTEQVPGWTASRWGPVLFGVALLALVPVTSRRFRLSSPLRK